MMKTTGLVPAVLLFTLSAPVLPGASGAPAIARSRTRTTPTAVEVRRDSLSSENVALAGAYLGSARKANADSSEAQSAWDAFYPACDETIRAFAARFFRSSTDIDDCTQEVWIDLVRNLPEFTLDQSRGRFSSWLFTIVRNKATDMVRRQARRPAEPLTAAEYVQPDLSGEDPARALARKFDVQSVRDALARLKASTSEENYRLLHLRHIEGRDVSDVAAILGIAPQQVWAREHRMKRKLKSMLARSEELAPPVG